MCEEAKGAEYKMAAEATGHYTNTKWLTGEGICILSFEDKVMGKEGGSAGGVQ